MARKILMVVLVIATLTLAACASTVKFKGPTSIADKTPLMLIGSLMKPQGDGPFPAVVLLHACAGIDDRQHIWAWRLKKWGYVSLIVDSFGPRRVSNVCGGGSPYPAVRAQDAHNAKSYLVTLPIVDPNRIAVMGWSHGGTSVLHAVSSWGFPKSRVDPFRAAIAFYPYCLGDPLKFHNVPLLILIGEKDDWTPASLCASNMPRKVGWIADEVDLVLKVYPGAYHCFDDRRKDRTYRGHWLAYHPAAAADAIVQVRNFLTKHLK